MFVMSLSIREEALWPSELALGVPPACTPTKTHSIMKVSKAELRVSFLENEIIRVVRKFIVSNSKLIKCNGDVGKVVGGMVVVVE